MSWFSKKNKKRLLSRFVFLSQLTDMLTRSPMIWAMNDFVSLAGREAWLAWGQIVDSRRLLANTLPANSMYFQEERDRLPTGCSWNKWNDFSLEQDERYVHDDNSCNHLQIREHLRNLFDTLLLEIHRKNSPR